MKLVFSWVGCFLHEYMKMSKFLMIRLKPGREEQKSKIADIMRDPFVNNCSIFVYFLHSHRFRRSKLKLQLLSDL